MNADHRASLNSIFGTEKDKVNCSFFFKTGSCRHGEQCSRAHNKPSSSQTILIRNLYIPVRFSHPVLRRFAFSPDFFSFFS
jgi:hypothetical protein